VFEVFDAPAQASAPLIDASIIAAARADAAPAPAAPGSIDKPIDRSIVASVDHAAAAVSLVELAAVMLFPLWPSLSNVYPIEKRTAIAEALGPVLKKYNIDLNALPPELVLAIVLVPTLPAAVAAVRADRAARLKPPNVPVPANEKIPQTPKPQSTIDRFPGLNRTETIVASTAGRTDVATASGAGDRAAA
jgi:hypothetical protein